MPADLTALINSWDLSLSAEGKSCATIASYLLTLRRFIALQHQHDTPTDVAQVRRAHIEAWIVELRDSRSPATAGFGTHRSSSSGNGRSMRPRSRSHRW